MTLLAKKELAKMVFMVLLALNVAMNLLHTFGVVQVAAVRILSGVISVGVLLALVAWFVLARRLRRTMPAQID